MSTTALPFEILEPILLDAIEPGTHAGAQLLLVCGLWHAIGRRRLYERVELKSQEGYDSYFVLGPHVATAWRSSIHEVRQDDWAQLKELKLSFAPLKKVPFQLSATYPSGDPYFPLLKTIHLNLSAGSSYLSARPKPLSRRVAKFLGSFSPDKLVIAANASADVTLAAISSVTLHATKRLDMASHSVGFLPLTYLKHAPLQDVVLRPCPAVRTPDVVLLSTHLASACTLHVRFGPKAVEPWYDREMRQALEKTVLNLRMSGREDGRWVDKVRLEFEDDDRTGDGEEYDLERAVEEHPVYPEGSFF